MNRALLAAYEDESNNEFFDPKGVLITPRRWGKGQGARRVQEPQPQQRYVKNIVARTGGQAGYLSALEESPMVVGLGPAGSGKTYMSVAYGCHLLETGRTDRLVLCRPAVEAGEHLGFMPGGLRDKIDHHMRPLYDAILDRMSPQRLRSRLEDGSIEIVPYAFMRGRTIGRCFIVADEANNATDSQLTMLATRPGEGTRIVINGDPDPVQCDNPLARGSLERLASRLEGRVAGLRVVRLGLQDVVRSDLVREVLAALEATR